MDSNQNIPIPPAQTQTSVVSSAADLKLPTQPEKSLSVPHKTSWGALIGIIIIVVLLIIGALYFWGAKLEQTDSSSLSANNESSK